MHLSQVLFLLLLLSVICSGRVSSLPGPKRSASKQLLPGSCLDFMQALLATFCLNSGSTCLGVRLSPLTFHWG